MSQEKKKSTYQVKMRVRRSMANKIGGQAFYTSKDGKRIPHALPILHGMKAQKETEAQDLAATIGVEISEEEIKQEHEYDGGLEGYPEHDLLKTVDIPKDEE